MISLGRVALIIAVLGSPASTEAQSIRWRSLEPGLEIAVIHAPRKSSHADSRFTVVRVDPTVRKLTLMTASEVGGSKRTAPQWAGEFDLSLVVNAGMFEQDHSTATYFMKNFTHLNNPRIASQNAFLAFNPVDGTVPPVQIIDRRCQRFPRLEKMYNTIIQGIRMVDCRQKRTWSTQNRKWSMVVAAMDMKGRVLFIFTRSPYRVQVFVDMLLGLPLDIRNMMYLEGGPEASLYLSAGETVVEKFGSYETGFCENDENKNSWPIPNVIGVVKSGSVTTKSNGMEKYGGGIPSNKGVQTVQDQIIAEAEKYLGREYVFGGRDGRPGCRRGGRRVRCSRGIDCQSLIFFAYEKVLGRKWSSYSVMPSVCVRENQLGRPVKGLDGVPAAELDQGRLHKGDVLFFLLKDYNLDADRPLLVRGGNRYGVWHTGLVHGRRQNKVHVIHAKPGDKVLMEPLEDIEFDAIFVVRLPLNTTRRTR